MKQEGFVSIILTAIITAVIIAGGTYVVLEQQAEERVAEVSRQASLAVQRQAQEQINRLNEKIEDLEDKLGNSADFTLDSTGKQIYKNNKLGFSLEFPKEWEYYIASQEDDSVRFGFELQDDLFYISRLTKEKWQEINSEVGPKPKYINENAEHVFVYSQAQDTYEELIDESKMVPQIISTFKFLDDISDWVIYRNTWDSNYSGPGGQLAIDFTIWYPSDFRIEGNNLSRIIGEKGKGNMLAMINGIEKKSFNYYKENNNPNASLDDFLLQEAENMCAADGPSGSIYCKDVVITERGRTDNGYDFLRIDMTEVASFASNNWQEEYRPRGPVYIVDIYDFTNGDYHFLVIQPRDIGISDFDGLDDILRKMINSLKIE